MSVPEETRRPRVAIVGMGGTIHSTGKDSLDLHNYGRGAPMMDIEALVAGVPEVEQVADVVLATHRTGPSTAITSTEWLALNEMLHELVSTEEGLDGLVITHGTATIEETAYFLDLSLKVEIPVVLTGSQRPFSALSTDAGMNFVNAVRTAGSPAARGLGVLVLLNDEIQAAREVTKTSTYRLETFRSPDMGMLGYADPDQIVIYRRPSRRHAPHTEFELRGRTELPRVAVVYSYVDADGFLIDALVDAGVNGIVVAGFAPGGSTPDQTRAIEDARKRGVAVVQSCRAGSGRILDTLRLQEQDVVAADNLNPQKARILLMLALTVTNDPAELKRIFAEY